MPAAAALLWLVVWLSGSRSDLLSGGHSTRKRAMGEQIRHKRASLGSILAAQCRCVRPAASLALAIEPGWPG